MVSIVERSQGQATPDVLGGTMTLLRRTDFPFHRHATRAGIDSSGARAGRSPRSP